MTAMGLLFDVTACALCGACWLADKERNKLPIPEGDFTQDALSDTAFLAMERRQGRGVRHSCMHCVQPTCASVCPVAALEKTPVGAVVYHQERCIGCRYCVIACPFCVPKYEWSKQLPYVRKCDLCHSRIAAGESPACAAACPTGALLYGERSALLHVAHERIAAGKGAYLDRVYGEHEVGGTSLLILTDISLEELGYPTNLSSNPMPSLTWEALVNVPRVVLLGGAMLTGLWWLTKRREEVRAARKEQQ
ncbi:MAG: 4Fe-4S dicluster domain-containing protein [Candidatus Yanofskybacteria bacterium]|nr:4Fe-4S dicluster domain-containing protein [Candidatus Yanofskybacteria bacterium]